MEKHWSVSVNIGANNILNIGSDYLSGWDDVMDYADTVQGCAEHLLSFVGRESETTTELRAEVSRLTALCDEYRGEVGRLLQEVTPAREIVQRGFKDTVGTIREAIEIEAYASALNKAEVNRLQSALTRARAEGMEEGLKTAAETVYSAICSYRSTVAQDEEGNGLELSDVLAHGYGDSDISRAKGELALLSDHIYCEIMNHEITSAEACRLAEQANKGEKE